MKSVPLDGVHENIFGVQGIRLFLLFRTNGHNIVWRMFHDLARASEAANGTALNSCGPVFG